MLSCAERELACLPVSFLCASPRFFTLLHTSPRGRVAAESRQSASLRSKSGSRSASHEPSEVREREASRSTDLPELGDAELASLNHAGTPTAAPQRQHLRGMRAEGLLEVRTSAAECQAAAKACKERCHAWCRVPLRRGLQLAQMIRPRCCATARRSRASRLSRVSSNHRKASCPSRRQMPSG